MASSARWIAFTSWLLFFAVPAQAQVPARADAVVWRGLEVRWGFWTHRMGELSSFITTGRGPGHERLVSNSVSGGDLRDPGGVKILTYYSQYQPTRDDGSVAFWHLEGDQLLLGGRYDCTEVAGMEQAGFRGPMVLGDAPVRGFDPSRIDPDGLIPDDFDHVAVLLNGIAVDPLTPNGSHTLDHLHVAITGPPGYDLASGALHVPLDIEYRPGCIPDDPYVCSNPVEAPRGVERWEAVIRPYFLVVAWNDGAGEETGTDGWLVDPAPRHTCGDGQRVKLSEVDWIATAADPALGETPLLGFQEFGIFAGAPGAWYEEGEALESCEHCAVALTGRHLRRFRFTFLQDASRGGAVHTEVRARWESDPFDGNPMAVFSSNPHWPEWTWTLWGLYLDGDVDHHVWLTRNRPALVARGAIAVD